MQDPLADALARLLDLGLDRDLCRRAIAETRQRWGGSQVYIQVIDRRQRDEEIRAGLAAGLSVPALSRRVSASPATIRRRKGEWLG
jgi:Mor family transcriptional regulator